MYIQQVMSKQATKREAAEDVIARECLGVRVRLLSRMVTSLYDDALRPLGLTVSQMNMLVVVAKRGSTNPGEVGRTLHMEKSTVSRNLDRMRKHGWVAVLPGDSGRTHCLEVTAKGRSLLNRSLPLWRKAQQSALALLGEGGAEAVRQTAMRVWSQDRAG